jgi:hypothetical protein
MKTLDKQEVILGRAMATIWISLQKNCENHVEDDTGNAFCSNANNPSSIGFCSHGLCPFIRMES